MELQLKSIYEILSNTAFNSLLTVISIICTVISWTNRNDAEKYKNEAFNFYEKIKSVMYASENGKATIEINNIKEYILELKSIEDPRKQRGVNNIKLIKDNAKLISKSIENVKAVLNANDSKWLSEQLTAYGLDVETYLASLMNGQGIINGNLNMEDMDKMHKCFNEIQIGLKVRSEKVLNELNA